MDDSVLRNDNSCFSPKLRNCYASLSNNADNTDTQVSCSALLTFFAHVNNHRLSGSSLTKARTSASSSDS